MSDTISHNQPPPTAYCPPQEERPDGVLRLPVDLGAGLFFSYSRWLKGCCWKPENLRIFGPERVELTKNRTTVPLPKSLASKGVDDATWAEFLSAVRDEVVASTPRVSPSCCFFFGFTLVLIPIVWCYTCGFMCCWTSKLATACENRLEQLARETDEKWRVRFGISVELEREQTWERPYIPADDSISFFGMNKLPLESSTWNGSVLKFAPVNSAYT